LDELSKLEGKVDKLVLLINELKTRLEEHEEESNRLRNRDKEIKEKIDNLVNRIDRLVI
jgi:FtsZ-binding cell division protein ZapB